MTNAAGTWHLTIIILFYLQSVQYIYVLRYLITRKLLTTLYLYADYNVVCDRSVERCFIFGTSDGDATVPV